MLPGAIQFFATRKAAPPLPYDAEVEYLESTGTQWIDTGVLCVDGLRTSIRFRFTHPELYNTEFVFGAQLGRTSSYHVGHYDNSNYGGNAFSLASYANHLVAFSDNSWHEAVLDTTGGDRQVSFDGDVTPDASTYASPGSLSLVLFARRTNSTTVSGYAHAQVSSCSILDTSTGQLLLDLIPVRKDGVGYMYDKVSGNLLGVSGTGAFAVGPDKASPSLPYDAEVAYIERDMSIAPTDGWTGFDLERYKNGSKLTTETRSISAIWSFSAETPATLIKTAIRYTINALDAGLMFHRAANGTVYRFGLTANQGTAQEGGIDVFHEQTATPTGGGTWMFAIDGDIVGTWTSTSTTAFQFLSAMFSTSSVGTGRYRVKSVRIGTDVDLIPVVKGNAVGFYNKVDGEMFLAEQACLSAGPMV